MVRIRLRRVGAKNQPSWRIMAADRESPRDGRFLEILGSYNPRTEPSSVTVDEARLFHWMKNGAQPSDSVFAILKRVGTWERWERFKQGENLETLVAEAKQAIPSVDPRTRRDAQAGQRSGKKSRSKKEGKPEKASAAVEAAGPSAPEVAPEAPGSSES